MRSGCSQVSLAKPTAEEAGSSQQATPLGGGGSRPDALERPPGCRGTNALGAAQPQAVLILPSRGPGVGTARRTAPSDWKEPGLGNGPAGWRRGGKDVEVPCQLPHGNPCPQLRPRCWMPGGRQQDLELRARSLGWMWGDRVGHGGAWTPARPGAAALSQEGVISRPGTQQEPPRRCWRLLRRLRPPVTALPGELSAAEPSPGPSSAPASHLQKSRASRAPWVTKEHSREASDQDERVTDSI